MFLLLSPVTLISILCFTLFCMFLLHDRKKKKVIGAAGKVLPPGLPKLPIIGNLHQLHQRGELPHRSLWKFSREFGPILMLQLGSLPTLVVSSSDLAKQVMKTLDSDCCGRPPAQGPKKLSYNFLDVAFSPPSDYWREMRKVLVHELVSEKRASSLWRARESELARLVAALSNASPDHPVDLHDAVTSLADAVVNTFAFGKTYGGKQFKNDKCQDVLSEAQIMLSSFSAEQFFPSIGWIIDAFTGRRAKQNRCFRNIDDYLQLLIDEHLDPACRAPPKSSESEEDLVDVLLRLSKDDGEFGFRLTHDHIKAILMDTFVGGTDTSVLTTVWAMSELMANPRTRKKVQAEIRSCVGRKGKVEKEDLPKLKYLKMVVMETLRMHPPAPLLVPHWTKNQVQIINPADGCKYDILPGTTILINAFAIARDPESWKHPNEFYPERFDGSEIDYKGQHFELLPFGSGRRICPGMTMGVSNVEFFLANLLYCFDWELPKGMKPQDIDMREAGGITVHRKTPLYVVPIKFDHSVY